MDSTNCCLVRASSRLIHPLVRSLLDRLTRSLTRQGNRFFRLLRQLERWQA
jgi:hypothetical protein